MSATPPTSTPTAGSSAVRPRYARATRFAARSRWPSTSRGRPAGLSPASRRDSASLGSARMEAPADLTNPGRTASAVLPSGDSARRNNTRHRHKQPPRVGREDRPDLAEAITFRICARCDRRGAWPAAGLPAAGHRACRWLTAAVKPGRRRRWAGLDQDAPVTQPDRYGARCRSRRPARRHRATPWHE